MYSKEKKQVLDGKRMKLIQFSANEDAMEIIMRLKRFFQFEQEEKFHGKTFNTGFMSGKRKRIRKARINYTFIIKTALDYYWDKFETDKDF